MFKVGEEVEVIIDKCNYTSGGKDIDLIEKIEYHLNTGRVREENGIRKLVDDKIRDEEPLGEQAPDPSEFISLDYRTEYHNKVAECEKLKAQVEYLWKQVLGE